LDRVFRHSDYYWNGVEHGRKFLKIITMNDKEKWALLLGASSGIGLASAMKLADEGFNLCLVYRARRSESKEVEEQFSSLKNRGVKLLSFNSDALKPSTIEKVISALKGEQARVSLLLHSVAKGNLKLMVPVKNPDLLPPALQQVYTQQSSFLKEDDFLLTSQAMAVSYYTWVKAIFDEGLFSPPASCLALTSEGGRKAWRNYAAVSAAKASLEAISRNIALEFAQYGIRSNILQPGVTDTPSLRMIPGSDYLIKNAVQRNPFGRLTQADDVARVVFLMSKQEASWINGALIPVDGGESIS